MLSGPPFIFFVVIVSVGLSEVLPTYLGISYSLMSQGKPLMAYSSSLRADRSSKAFLPFTNILEKMGATDMMDIDEAIEWCDKYNEKVSGTGFSYTSSPILEIRNLLIEDRETLSRITSVLNIIDGNI